MPLKMYDARVNVFSMYHVY